MQAEATKDAPCDAVYDSRRLVLERAIREGMQLRVRGLACLSRVRSVLWQRSTERLGIINGADPGASTWRKMPAVLVECSLVLRTYASVLSHTEYHE